jgi:hypothetical protein
MRWTGHVARMGASICVSTILVEKPGGKRPLGRHRLTLEDNIKIDLQEVECEECRSMWLRIGTDGGHLLMR